MSKVFFPSCTLTLPISSLSIPYLFRPLYIREGYGIDTAQIRGKYGTNPSQLFLKHAVTTLLMGLRYGSTLRRAPWQVGPTYAKASVAEGKMLKLVQHDIKRVLLCTYRLTAVIIRFLPTVEMTRLEGRLCQRD